MYNLLVPLENLLEIAENTISIVTQIEKLLSEFFRKELRNE